MLSFNSRYFFSTLKIDSKFSWPISSFIRASDILLKCYFFFFFLNVFINPNVIENVRPHLPSIIPAGAPVTDTNDAIEMLLDSTEKKIIDLLKYSKKTIYLLTFLVINSLSLISNLKKNI